MWEKKLQGKLLNGTTFARKSLQCIAASQHLAPCAPASTSAVRYAPSPQLMGLSILPSDQKKRSEQRVRDLLTFSFPCGYTVFLRSLRCVSSNPGLPRSGHVANAVLQIHFEVGVLVLLQRAVQEEECFPLMFISCEHCRPCLELISCVVLCKNRKYILPTFQML